MQITLKKYGVWALLLAAVIMQLYGPVKTIAYKNDLLKTGTEYNVRRTEVVDPINPFKGRYVAINLGVDVPAGMELKINGGDSFYMRLETDAEGFAIITELSAVPIEGPDVLKLSGRAYRMGWFTDSVQIPIYEYYMQEKLAPAAERAYLNERDKVYAVIRVKNLDCIIEGLYVGGERIEDYVARESGAGG